MSSSTVKMIVSRYEKTGTVFQKKKEKNSGSERTEN